MNFVKPRTHKGLNTTRGEINHGMNSGYQAINLAYHFGVSRILLIGYDMQRTGGQAHWHGDHPKGLTNAEGLNKWAARFPKLAEDLAKEGVEVINCSRETALRCFSRARLEDVI